MSEIHGHAHTLPGLVGEQQIALAQAEEIEAAGQVHILAAIGRDFLAAAFLPPLQGLQAVAQAIAEAAPSEMDTPMLTPMVKRAMSKSIEEKGVIDVKDVAEEVFRSDPEREAIIEQVARQIQEEQLEPVIPVENKRVVAQLQRVKIKTDNGISITLPRELADDENSFAVVENGDGTISIIINKGFSIYYMIIASGIKRYHGFISQHVFPWTKRMGSFTTPDL